MALIRPDNGIPVPALLKRFALIYLPVVVALSVAILLSTRFDDQMRMEKMEAHESNQVEIAKALVTRDLSTVDTDLRIIASLPLLRWYQDSGNPAYREELEKLLLVLARETRRYDQVRYLDASGQEVIRINYNDGKPAIVPREQLQNKFGRYYFDDTIKLNAGEIFVSPLDLNIEQGSLEIPHKPMIRFGTPVFDSAGRKKGIILLNYFGDKLLQKFHEKDGDDQEKDHHSHMLLNRDGYWLHSDRPEDEWGFMLGKKERTFGHDFPEVWRAISATERGTLRTDQGLFTYTTFYPMLPKQHSSTGSALANAPSQQELEVRKYYWKIVTFVPHAELSDAAFYNRTGGRVLLVMVYLLLALTAWIVASATLIRKQASDAVRKLNDELEQKVIARTAQLERAKLEVEQASRGKDEFLAAISHELKTPLNHILGFADLLKEGLVGELSAEQKGMAQDIFDAGSKQLAIVNSLIELARLQAGKVTLQAKPEDTALMLGEIAARHAAKAKAAGLVFAVELAQGLGELPLDREVVTHLLDQLLANAFKFTPVDGKVSLAARRVPRTDVAAPVRIEAGEYLELAVADNGPGVAPEILPRLFQPFVQGEGGLSRSHGGTGVGLTLVRLLAALHGGGSGVESKPGIGAKFLIWLPCGAARPGGESVPPSPNII